MKETIKGVIRNASAGFAITDPNYGNDVKCRFCVQRIPKDSVFTAEITLASDIIHVPAEKGCRAFDVSVIKAGIAVRRRVRFFQPFFEVRDGRVLITKGVQHYQYEIGVDSAALFAGKRSSLASDCPAIMTGGDGYMGDVHSFSLPGNAFWKELGDSIIIVPGGFYGFYAALEFDAEYVEFRNLADYLVESFQLEKVTREATLSAQL